jgi:uncharacterized small protein (DUF1192 family)
VNLEDLEPTKKPAAKKDLTVMGVDELNAYIAVLKEEIGRAEAAIAAKQAHRSGAEAFFKK